MRLLATLVLFLIAVGISKPLRADAVDAFVQAEMRSQNIPGIAVAVVKD
jgi:CubicO group peptidase (beta-lactamase class C family)